LSNDDEGRESLVLALHCADRPRSSHEGRRPLRHVLSSQQSATDDVDRAGQGRQQIGKSGRGRFLIAQRNIGPAGKNSGIA
jgi:hypothetical protein